MPHQARPLSCFFLILLDIFRFVAAKELLAASFQHYLYHRGCVEQRNPVNTRGIKRPMDAA
jgi:hypothetical protein